ncbi:serine/threonine-protein kinase [Paucibacter oligotrophus]|uniref:Serine/threonine-protein kinase n=1 Tax=Roseateles oligotrophus TaxID=1769250 RepID=A0A840L7I5_9BURK|nr:serine/threonine-protein kinase [Roseateles oligotrophus]MBB4843731.1 serine/threonine-protein kinase [Roseateles oligotrophus]
MSVQEDASPAEFTELKALFNELCELPDAAAQNARLDELKTPAPLKLRVLSLLAQQTGEQSRFARPLLETLAGGPELRVGDTVGAWRLVSVLGHGGMGQVYLAERSDGHYQQLAALKLLRSCNDEAALAQLAHERQILAGLNHPHIARLIDGGTTPRGRPYLVMDYVQGESLLRYALRQRLNLRELLNLFGMVCDALAYAHRQLILHCDIKPSNVLVDLDGRAMLLDFGVAQLQGGDGRAGSDTLAATPRYASPEQLAGRPASAASDVFGLGRLLQELLRCSPALLTSLGEGRQRELQAIAAKATHEDPEQRYLSVPELQADLQRFRQHRPLQALAPTRRYRSQKFLRRHWPAVSVASATLLLSSAFTWQVMEERDRAESARSAAAQVSDFMLNLFITNDPSFDVPAAKLLSEAQTQLEQGLGEQPEVQAQLYLSLGIVQKNRGELKTARQLLARGAEIERSLGGQNILAALHFQLGDTANQSGDYPQAMAAALEGLRLRQAMNPPNSNNVNASKAQAGFLSAMAGHAEQGLPLLEEALRQAEAERPGSHAHALALSYLSTLRREAADYPAAAELARRALDIRLKIDGPQHPRSIKMREDLALIRALMGAGAQGIAELQACIQQREEQSGKQHLSLARSWDLLGRAHSAAGQFEAAIQAHERARAMRERLGQQDSGVYHLGLLKLAQAQLQLGRKEAARLHLQAVLDYGFAPTQPSYQKARQAMALAES